MGAATILKKEAVENKDEPKWIYIDEDRLSKVESFLLKNSVLSQQLYGPRNQQLVFHSGPVQASKPSQSSAANKVQQQTFPGSSTLSQSQTQTDSASAGTSKNQEFWQDAEIVKDEDFSNWEMPHAPSTGLRKTSQNNAVDFISVNSTVTSGIMIKDIFTGSPWRPLSMGEHKKLDRQLLQEFSQRQNMLESRLSWFSEETKRLPVANHR